MKRARPRAETRASRDRYSFWMKAIVWAFIVIFAFSVMGGVVALTAMMAAH